jgi:murein DD-endopeptidase MepM/ murein hydrolase activator NlpD
LFLFTGEVNCLTNSSAHPPDQEKYGRAALRTAIRRFFTQPRHKLLISTGLSLALLAAAGYLVLHQARKNREVHAKLQKPPVAATPSIPEFKQIVGIFQRNQTITQVLLQQGLPLPLVHQIIDCARPVYDLAKVRAEKLYWLCFTKDGQFRDFRYHVDDEHYLTVYHDVEKDRIVPVMKNFLYETRVEIVSGEIESSLFASVTGVGEKDQLALDLADIFGSDIDFYTDLQKGDSYRILIEKKYLDGQFSKNGAILAASFANEKREHIGIRFEDEKSKPAYYAPDGKALKKSFLKSPLKFARISSRFSLARMHPILKILRPHLGVDYAAPLGTPVQSVGAGVVTGTGSSGGSGKIVNIRHLSGYETSYLHLSRIAVRRGAHVEQGEVIGFVGSSGLSTGPHLDFRIRQHGKPINPAKVIFPPGAPVPPARFANFAALRDKMIDDLRLTNDEIKQASIQGKPAP